MDNFNYLNRNGYEVRELLSSGSYGDCLFVRTGNKSVILKLYKSDDAEECYHEKKVYIDLHGEKLGKDWLFKVERREIDGHHMLEMDTYEGDTLEDRLFNTKEELSITDKLQLLIKACETISNMHKSEKPYVHLDIKPSNFYVSTNLQLLKPIDLGSAVNIKKASKDNDLSGDVKLEEKPEDYDEFFYDTMNAIGYMSTREYASKRVREFNELRKEYRTFATKMSGKVQYLVSAEEKEELLRLVRCIGVKDDIYSLICCVFNAFTGGREVEFWLDHDGEYEDINEAIQEVLRKNNVPDYIIPNLEELFLELDGPNQDFDKEVRLNSVDELIERLEVIKAIYENRGFHPEVLLRNSKDYFEKHFSNVEINKELLCQIEKIER